MLCCRDAKSVLRSKIYFWIGRKEHTHIKFGPQRSQGSRISKFSFSVGKIAKIRKRKNFEPNGIFLGAYCKIILLQVKRELLEPLTHHCLPSKISLIHGQFSSRHVQPCLCSKIMLELQAPKRWGSGCLIA